jgi:hypothetical protein
MPELELRQAANEGAELVVLARGQGRRAAVQAVVSVRRSNRRVEFRRQEGEEQVQKVDAEGVGDLRQMLAVNPG